jgi:ABC-type lipoprotein export system ATPase subunit
MPYRGNPRGALWNKWDLHVHTPASYVQNYGDRESEDVWTKYFDGLASLPREITVLGINDYYSVGGYRRVREAWQSGALPNIRLVLPVVEIRLEHLAGQSDTQRLNYHVVFSDELSPDEIERSFLHHLIASVGGFSSCVGHKDGLEAFGRAVKEQAPTGSQPQGSDAIVGFHHAFVPLDKVEQALKENTVFCGKQLVGLGYSEWDAMRWTGGGGAVKRNAAHSAQFLFGCSAVPSDHNRHVASLRANEINRKLIDASDAHRFADDTAADRRLGATMTWIKADETFEGLRRALQRYDERVFVGDEPKQLTRLRTSKNRFLRSVDIHKKRESSLPELWFDNSVPLNPGLVALIGNQGGGKSALTDCIALAANSETSFYSFLNEQRFRKPRSGKAAHFEATIVWEDGESQIRGLDEARIPEQPERARYVPQHFFDKATNEIEMNGGGTLYTEIEKAVFSHIPPAQRQHCTSFRALVDERTAVIDEAIADLRAQLADCNFEIANLEQETASSARASLRSRIEGRQLLIAQVTGAPPTVVSAPPDETGDHRLDRLRSDITALGETVREAAQQEATEFNSRQGLTRFRETVLRIAEGAERERDEAFASLENGGSGLAASDVLAIAIDLSQVDARIRALEARLASLRQVQDTELPGSAAHRLEAYRAELDQRTQSLTTARRAYETYLNAHAEWLEHLHLLGSNPEDPDALDGLIAEKTRIEETVPQRLAELRTDRGDLCMRIHQALGQKLAVYRALALHVEQFLADEELTRDHYRLKFELALTPKDVSEAYFRIVKHQGPFAGSDAARAWVKSKVETCDFSNQEAVLGLVGTLEARALDDQTADEQRYETISALLRSGCNTADFYNALYSLSFVAPRYRLALGERPLEELAPGERGILLLIFYLIVDKSELPLIIDQPEGNLNNQSIYEHLVPVFRRAKETRQIIMVSHNPNMVVGADADQIVHAQFDASSTVRLSYVSGALENPQFRNFTIDKLEGTRPAFNERTDAYLE